MSVAHATKKLYIIHGTYAHAPLGGCRWLLLLLLLLLLQLVPLPHQLLDLLRARLAKLALRQLRSGDVETCAEEVGHAELHSISTRLG